MKRTIAFVISFTLSFLFFFSSIAMAEEIKIQIPESTSQLRNPGIMIQVPAINVERNSSNVVSKVSTKISKISGRVPVHALESCTKEPGECNIYYQSLNSSVPGYYLGSGSDRTCLPCPT